MKKFALIGENIGYSKSPEIHKAFYEVTGINAEYELLDIPAERFQSAALKLWVFDGFNVTKPYKERILPFLSGHSDASGQRLTTVGHNGAEYNNKSAHCAPVNTVVVRDGLLYGYNTDGSGFNYATRNIDFTNRSVLILGAGGVAKIIAGEVNKRGGIIAIHNRTAERAVKIIENMGTGRLMEKEIRPEVIINATNVGQTAEDMCLPDFVDITDTELIFDTIYRKTPVLRLAESRGIIGMDGYEMLVYQAIAAECLFNGMNISDGMCESVFALLGDKKNI